MAKSGCLSDGRIKDNSVIRVSELIQKRNKTDKLINYLKNLELFLKSKISPNEIIFGNEYEANFDSVFDLRGESYDDMEIITNNIVGTIQYDNVRFEIRSRFGDRFLLYMIANAEGFLEYEDLGSLEKDAADSLGEWMLVYLWKQKLKKAAALGMYKSYEERKEELRGVKGSVDFSNVRALAQKRLECRYREHVYDNEINYKIRLALEKSFKKYQHLVKDLGYLKRGFDEIKIPKRSSSTIRNPYYYPYKEVYELSLKILRDEYAAIGGEKFNALLFDISMLFEHHIRKLLMREFTIDEKNKKEFTIPTGVRKAPIYPDVVIKHSDDEISIYDVKYKRFDTNEGVLREDRFQLVSYVAIYGQKYKIKECGFIYPKNDDKSEEWSDKLKICDNKNNIPFKIKFYPVTSDGDFKTKQRKLDEEFIETFIKKS